jgi:endonuclease III
MKKTGVVKVDADVHRLVKIASAISDKNCSEIVHEALVDWLDKNKTRFEKEIVNAG